RVHRTTFARPAANLVVVKNPIHAHPAQRPAGRRCSWWTVSGSPGAGSDPGSAAGSGSRRRTATSMPAVRAVGTSGSTAGAKRTWCSRRSTSPGSVSEQALAADITLSLGSAVLGDRSDWSVQVAAALDAGPGVRVVASFRTRSQAPDLRWSKWLIRF